MVTKIIRTPRCPKCKRSVIYCDCGFTTLEDSKKLAKGIVPKKYKLNKKEKEAYVSDMS